MYYYLLNTTTVRYLVGPHPTQSLTGSLTATGMSEQVQVPSMAMRSVREANLLAGLFQKINIIMFIFIIIKLINIMIIYFINSDVFYIMPLWSALLPLGVELTCSIHAALKSKMDKTKLQFPEIFTKILSLGTSQYRTASKETWNLLLNTRT